MKDYIPAPMGKRKTWYQHEIDTLDAVYLGIGMTPAQVASYKASCLLQIQKINAVNTAKAILKGAVADRKTTSATEDAKIRIQVKTFKTNTSFTNAIGETLQVMDSSEHVDYPHYVPEIDGEAFPGYIRIVGVMNGLENLNIYRRLKGTSAWGRSIATIAHPKYDDHSLPTGAAVYEYIIIGLMDDVEVTKESKIEAVTYAG